jgi:phasin family protein
MFPFDQSVNPALRSHLDSQLAFFNDLSQSLSGSFQSVCQANLKLTQNMLEETLSAGRRMLTSGQANDLAGTVLPDTQPSSEHMRTYQQHISSIAAGSQVDLARVTHQHGRETSRTAQVLADEVARASVEAAERNVQQKEEFLKNFRNPLQQDGAQGGKAARANGGAHMHSEAAGASMQSESRAERAPSQGNMQGQAVPPAQKPDKK